MLRVVLAVSFVWTLGDGGWTPLAIFVVAALSDYVDGPLARRAGASTRHGVLLDSGADIAFVLSGAAAGVATGRLAWLVPVAIACAGIPYLVATMRQSRARAQPVRAYSPIGHAAGVCNYALVGLLAGSVALPAPAWSLVLALASVVVVVLNLAAVALRMPRPRG